MEQVPGYGVVAVTTSGAEALARLMASGRNWIYSDVIQTSTRAKLLRDGLIEPGLFRSNDFQVVALTDKGRAVAAAMGLGS
jgi:hypothetical protein